MTDMLAFVMRARRGDSGLGLVLDKHNVVARLNGSAEEDGLLAVGDEVLAVDGSALSGRAMASVITPGLAAYELTVMRRSGPLLESAAKLPLGHAARSEGGAPVRLERICAPLQVHRFWLFPYASLDIRYRQLWPGRDRTAHTSTHSIRHEQARSVHTIERSHHLGVAHRTRRAHAGRQR
jgi:hypothetical protein